MSTPTMPKGYCPSCDEMVEVFVMISGGQEKVHCSQCGLMLDEVVAKPAESLEAVIIAEDSGVLREILVKTLKEKKLARVVIPCPDGKAFLSSLNEKMKNNEIVNLVILDVQMPIINGINAAKTMRAMEEGFKRPRKIPILFFSVVRCDENFKKFLNFCKPAAYLNKGTSATPEQLASRVYEVVSRLLS